ncbi:MAG: hypothetical protein KIT27_11615 [Legionellales bacterium]|nr:hypothetical protein [Legionellales bacterium]
MTNSDMYLNNVIQKYTPRSLNNYMGAISSLKETLKSWANTCFIEIIESGSIAKGTAVSIASDVDFLVSLKSNCNENNGGLKSIYESLYDKLNGSYSSARKQNVSVRITLSGTSLLSNGLEVDITPARKQLGNTNNHSLWVSKLSTWKQTNIQKHINDVSQSRRTNEIKLLKIWRELNKLDFPSIYLEYLLIKNILKNKPSDPNSLANNFFHILSELAKTNENPLLSTTIDPANSNNVLSDLLTKSEKNKIHIAAVGAVSKRNWGDIIW